MTSDAVLMRKDDSLAVVTLNRPDKLNSLNIVIHKGLAAAIENIARDKSIRALLIAGAGRAFCAGQDLADPVANPEEYKAGLGSVLDRFYNPLVKTIRALPIPIVCAVNGVTAGAGVSLALACDIVIAARSASFILAFSNIGLVPDAGATFFLPRLIGLARATGLAMLGEPLSAEDAVRAGMIWKVTDDDALMSEATALAERLSKRATKSLALIKRGLSASFDNSLEAQLALEAALQKEAGLTHDFNEGRRAFLEKRAPVFKGE